MPDDSAGNYTRPPSPIPNTGQAADAPQVNVPIDDIAAALNRRHFGDGRRPFGGNQNLNGYRINNSANAVAPADLVPLSQVQALIAAISGALTGELKVLTGITVPSGYLRANGQSVLRATYPTLWTYAQDSGNLAATQGAKTAGQYGPGDGSTTFTLPDLGADGGQFVRPLPSSGRVLGSSQADELKSHIHGGSVASNGAHSHTYSTQVPSGSGGQYGGGTGVADQIRNTDSAGSHTHALTIDATGGTETRPKNIAYLYVIKT